MAPTIDELVRALLAGKKKAFEGLARVLAQSDLAKVILLLAHESDAVRVAAVRASAKRRPGEELVRAVAGLTQDGAKSVREEAVAALAGFLGSDLAEAEREVVESALTAFLLDREEDVRLAAAKASGGRASLVEPLGRALLRDDEWLVRQEAARGLGRADPAAAARPLLEALSVDADQDVASSCAKALEDLAERGALTADFEPVQAATLLKCARRLRRVGGAPRTLEWIEERTREEPDTEALAKYGPDLTVEAAAGKLPGTFFSEPEVEEVLGVLRGPGARAVVLHGASGTGKTALVQALAARLAAEEGPRWSLVQISPTDLLAGTLYVGEWQTKVRTLIEAVARPRRAILYVPNLDELIYAGQSSSSDSSVASMLAPHVESGRVAVIGETTPAGWAQGLGRHPSLSRLFTRVAVAPATAARTRELMELVALDAGSELEPGLIDYTAELADAYLGAVERPGRAVGLLRKVLDASGGGPIEQQGLVTLVQASTGIPLDFFDDRTPLDLERVRDFFAARVMGQAEAIEAVLDLITLKKAGLTDPAKPGGVFLFVGPTGVGKTELARALAELLFGDTQRLLRFDMSEYATYDGFQGLIGKEGSPGKLTQAVADQPFSVVLLDEIEKAHGNVFDLMLQVFDAGRLTDGRGRTVSFVNTVVIMTSNVGSAVPTERPVGFGDGPVPVPDRDTVLRELRRHFRPEFLNRLDRVIHFSPLGLGTADRIARREVSAVLRRGGIERRGLSVDLDDAVYGLLLREGYSPALGARPLKRTVERLVLLPIARVIATGDAPPGGVLRLVVRGDEVRVDTAPEEGEQASDERPGAASVEELQERHRGLVERSGGLERRRADLIEHSSRADFWERRHRAVEVLDELHRVDRLIDDLRRLGSDLEVTRGNPNRRKAARYTERHARDLDRLDFLLGSDELGDALLTITRVRAERGGLAGVERLARMYLGLCRQRGLEPTLLDDRREDNGAEDTVTLLASGAGACAMLAAESGFHHLIESQGGRDVRELLRVEVLRAPLHDPDFASDEISVEVSILRDADGPLGSGPELAVQLLHRPSLTAVHAWTSGPSTEAVARLAPLLRARIDRVAAEEPEPPRVRRYVFGSAPLIRDARTGRATGRVDQVMRGEIDFLFG